MTGPIPGSGEELLNGIIGSSLYKVTFILDYVQLGFQGEDPQAMALLWDMNVENPLAVRDAQGDHSQPKFGLRDAPCDRIDRTVTAARTVHGEAIYIHFEDGAVFTVGLREQDFRGPEAAELHGPGGQWAVWQFGEMGKGVMYRTDV